MVPFAQGTWAFRRERGTTLGGGRSNSGRDRLLGGTDGQNWRTGRQSKQKDRWVGVRRADGGAGRAVGWTVRQADELSGQGGG